MKRWVKSFFLWALSAVVILSVLFLSFLKWPSLLFNNRSLQVALWFAEKKGVWIDWKTAELTAHSISIWKKRVELHSQEVCTQISDTNDKSCARVLNILLDFDLRRGIPNSLARLPDAVKLTVQEFTVQSDEGFAQGSATAQFQFPASLDVAIRGDLKKKGHFEVTGHSEPGISSPAVIQLHGEYQSCSQRVEATITSASGPTEHHMTIQGVGRNVISGVRKVELKGCQVHVLSRDITDTASVSCLAKFTFSLPKKAEKAARFINPLTLKVVAQGKQVRSQNDAPIEGEISLELGPILSAINEGMGKANIKLEGRPSEFPQQWFYDLEAALKVTKFEKVVSKLTGTPWEVPAPFNSLSGGVRVEASGRGRVQDPKIQIPISLKTRLSSPTQKLDIDADGEWSSHLIEGRRSMGVTAKISLLDVRLVLPHLDYRALPRVIPDSRIQSFVLDETVDRKAPFFYDIEVVSPKEHPARLVTNLAKQDVPVSVNLRLRKGLPLTGVFEISRVPLELFRRNAWVEYFRISATPSGLDNEIEGKINIIYTDYTISVMIQGLLNRPKATIMSSPPLSEKQVMAVLLFGRPIEELDSGELNSVGNARAALTDGAITLASMYALASTPVESVGYDPQSRVFSARVRLMDGTSLNIGTDLNRVRNLGVNKKLGAFWGIHSELEDPFDASRRSLSTFLEWNLRY